MVARLKLSWEFGVQAVCTAERPLQNGVEGKTERLSLTKQAHEFVHVAQYERLGREGFLQEYIQQIAAHGYKYVPFE